MSGIPLLQADEQDSVWHIERPFHSATLGVQIPPTPLSALGDPEFAHAHRVKYAYMAGAMAGEISGVELVVALARAGFLASYGAGGVPIPQVARAIAAIAAEAPGTGFAVNLIHSPQDPSWEDELVTLLLARQVPLVEASAYIQVNLPLVRFRLHGIHRGADGRVVAPNRVIAKLSRVEVAAQFFAPAPEALVQELLRRGELTTQQAALASEIPLASDITVEADSGGHTDNRPTLALFPTMIALREQAGQRYDGREPLRLGLAGGIGTPYAAHGAFALGAAYVVTGSVNQACVEAGTSQAVKELLAAAGQADTAMAPSAAMFELGSRVQVLKRGTMFPMRAMRLYEVYQRYGALEEIPPAEQAWLESNIFHEPLADAWRATSAFFADRQPEVLAKAESSPRLKMALVFRSYLGRSSRWAVAGDVARKMDYQIWCGPAIGAFNEWTRGSALAAPQERRVVPVARNFLHGAALLWRMQVLRCHGVALRDPGARLRPLKDDEIRGC